MESLEEIRALFEGEQYQIERELGAGSMGSVFLARHRRLKRRMVVKVLQHHLGGGTKDRFRMEAQMAAKLRHDNIVDVLDCGTLSDGRPYLVMEYLEGSTLDALLKEPPRYLPPARACAIAREVLAALGAAHDRGIIHRDIKPSNVFVTKAGRAKVIDFGVAKLTEALSGDVAPLRAPTAPGLMVGTPKYMAPEQTTGRKIDHRADIYSVGLLLYRMLSGTDPFAEMRDIAGLLRARASKMPPPPSACAPQAIDPHLDAVVMRALAIAPEARFRNAYEMSGALFELTGTYRELANQLGFETVDWGERAPATATVLSAAERGETRVTDVWPREASAMREQVPAPGKAKPDGGVARRSPWRHPEVMEAFVRSVLTTAIAGFLALIVVLLAGRMR